VDGAASCKPDPLVCTAAPYGGPLPVDALYVNATATLGGNGTAAAPFVTLAAALAVAQPDQVIAVNKGTYWGPFSAKVPVQVRGKCAAEVVLSSANADAPLWSWGGGKLELSDLQLTGEERAVAATAGTVVLRRVAVASARYIGLHVTDLATALLEDVVVRDTRPRADGKHGRGVWVEAGAALTLTGGAIVGNRTSGVMVAGTGTNVTLTKTIISGTAAQLSDNKGGRGLVVSDGAALALTDVQILSSYSSGIACYDAGVVALTGVVIADTQAEPASGGEGYGLLVAGGAVHARGVLVRANTTIGIYVTGASSDVTLEGAVVEDTAANNKGSGVGLVVESGAEVTGSALHVTGSTEYGVLVSGATSKFTTTNSLVANTAARNTDLAAGYGVWCQDGAACTLHQTRVHNNRTVSVTAAGSGTSLALTDVTISQTLSRQEDLGRGVGMQLVEGATCQANTVLVYASRTAGVWVSDPGPVELVGVQIAATLPQESDGWGGRGIHWVRSTPAPNQPHTIKNCVLRDNYDHQLYLDGDTLLLDKVAMASTKSDSFGDGGHAIQVRTGGKVTGTDVVLTDHRTAAVFARDPGTSVQLSGGCILRTAVREVDGAYGRGAVVEGGATMALRRMRLSGHGDIAISAASEAGGPAESVSALVVQDVVIDGTQVDGDAGALTGRGVESHNSRVEAGSLRVHNVGDVAVALYGHGGAQTTTLLRDLHMTSTTSATQAVALVAKDAGPVVIRRMRTSGPFAVHLEIQGKTQLFGGHVGLGQLSDKPGGIGLLCSKQATCQLVASQLTGAWQAAVLGLDAGTTVQLRGTAVGRDGDSQLARYGTVMLSGATLDATASVWHGAEVAAVASDAGSVSLAGCAVYQLAKASQTADGVRLTTGATGQFAAGQIAGFGRCGVLSAQGSSLALAKSVVADNRYAIGQMLNGTYTVVGSWLHSNQNQLASGSFPLPTLPARPIATEQMPAFTL
jgi:hypothetical protein